MYTDHRNQTTVQCLSFKVKSKLSQNHRCYFTLAISHHKYLKIKIHTFSFRPYIYYSSAKPEELVISISVLFYQFCSGKLRTFAVPKGAFYRSCAMCRKVTRCSRFITKQLLLTGRIERLVRKIHYRFNATNTQFLVV